MIQVQRDSWVGFKRLKHSVHVFLCTEESTGPTRIEALHVCVFAFALPHSQQTLEKGKEKCWKQ